MTHTTKLYFECHITIEPVFDEDLDCVAEITHTLLDVRCKPEAST